MTRTIELTNQEDKVLKRATDIYNATQKPPVDPALTFEQYGAMLLRVDLAHLKDSIKAKDTEQTRDIRDALLDATPETLAAIRAELGI